MKKKITKKSVNKNDFKDRYKNYQPNVLIVRDW